MATSDNLGNPWYLTGFQWWNKGGHVDQAHPRKQTIQKFAYDYPRLF